MSEALIGVLIGAGVGLITQLFDFLNSILKRRHERILRLDESYYHFKREALENYVSYLGISCGSPKANSFSLQEYMSLSNRARLFVSPDTAEIIKKVDIVVSEVWVSGGGRDLIYGDETAPLIDSIRDEMAACLERLEHPNKK